MKPNKKYNPIQNVGSHDSDKLMANWTVKEVSNWLKENGFKKQTKIFKEKNIDGNVLMKLTDDDISQLFIEVDEDGTIIEPIIGIKSRFRTKLTEWKLNINNEETPDDSLLVSTTNSYKDKSEEDVVSKKSTKKEIDNVTREEKYLVDDEIEIKFFKNSKFLQYFINFVKQETIPIGIEISKRTSDNDDEPSYGYTIKLTGTKQDNQVVRRFIKQLLKSIKTKIYDQKKLPNWSLKNKSIDIIQNILDTQSHIFTMSQFINRTLEISYFENEKFNSLQNSNEIDNIIQNQIFEKHIIWLTIVNYHTIEFIDYNTHEVLLKYPICASKQFVEEFQETLNQYKKDDSLVSITDVKYVFSRSYKEKVKHPIEIFGYGKSIDELVQKFKDLFEKHRLRKFRFSQMSTIELDCIANLCSSALRHLDYDIRDAGVEIYVEKNEFYASLCLKNEIRNRVKNLLINIKTKTFKNIDLYYNTADQLCSDIKSIAQRNQCHCDIQIKTKLKSYPILQGHKNILNTSKSIIEQSNLFCSLPLVSSQTKLTNGSIEIIISDIALQKVDIIIIPSTTFGLKESLIERAGEIIEKQSSNKHNSIPFITETTGGQLYCQKILFVNWSLPTMIINDDDLSESIRSFISKTIQYVVTDSLQSNLTVQSIAFAVPDSCRQEDVLAEEIIQETINQINLAKSVSLKVSFILLPDQETLHKQFLNAIQTIQKSEDSFGTFHCPTSIVTITLMCFDDDRLKKSEERIHNYLTRSMFKMKLDNFQHWNQSTINAFYKYSIDRCVLPKTTDQQQIILWGPINNVYEVNQKYQLMHTLIQTKINLPGEINTNILISYSSEDSIIAHRLANRLIDEGLSVYINSNQSIESNQILRKIKKSSLIIVCISENYFQNELCEKQVKYADEIGKNIIPIKIEYFQPIEWLQKLIEKYSYFQLFGSENHFNLEYEKILLKIYQYIKPTDISLSENIAELYFLLTPEQKKLKYEKNVEKIEKVKKGRINEDEKKDLSEKIQDIIQMKEDQCMEYMPKYQTGYSGSRYHHISTESSPDYEQQYNELIQVIRFDAGITSYKQWLDKLGSLKTILNIAPFTFTGDINDATFPLLNEARQNVNLVYSFGTHYAISTYTPRPSKRKKRVPAVIKKADSITNNDTSKEEQQIESKTNKRSSIVSRTSNYSVKRQKKEKKPQKSTRKRPSSPKLSLSKKEIIEFKSKFAERMQKINDEFHQFCQNYEQSSNKQKTQAYPTVLFGLNPFSDIKFEPRKPPPPPPNNKVDLPLKFPWNGVINTNTPTFIWTNPSTFFFISEKH